MERKREKKKKMKSNLDDWAQKSQAFFLIEEHRQQKEIFALKTKEKSFVGLSSNWQRQQGEKDGERKDRRRDGGYKETYM